jgi:cystathionine beta-lyase/cystathionine gamma-synthase
MEARHDPAKRFDIDSAYGPARNFCERVLTRCGVATTYYDPLIGGDIARLIRPNTTVVYVRYGLLGTPTTFALEEALAAIEGGYRAMLMSSGLAAITAPLQAFLKYGDLPTNPARRHSATRWAPEGPTLRLHIGLEDPQDLIEDLDRGLHALRKAAAS